MVSSCGITCTDSPATAFAWYIHYLQIYDNLIVAYFTTSDRSDCCASKSQIYFVRERLFRSISSRQLISQGSTAYFVHSHLELNAAPILPTTNRFNIDGSVVNESMHSFVVCFVLKQQYQFVSSFISSLTQLTILCIMFYRISFDQTYRNMTLTMSAVSVLERERIICLF